MEVNGSNVLVETLFRSKAATIFVLRVCVQLQMEINGGNMAFEVSLRRKAARTAVLLAWIRPQTKMDGFNIRSNTILLREAARTSFYRTRISLLFFLKMYKLVRMEMNGGDMPFEISFCSKAARTLVLQIQIWL